MAFVQRLLGKRQDQRAAEAANPELVKKVDLLESMYKKIFDYQELDAAEKADLKQQIRTLEHDRDQHKRELREAREVNQGLVQQIGNLQGRLDVSEHGRETQGIRLGKLEKQVEEIPGLRHQLVKAQMSTRIYQLWGAEQAKRLEEAGLPFDPEPHIPNVPPPHPDDPGGS